MIHYILFTKDRPLQCHGHLASLIHNLGEGRKEVAISVMLPNLTDEYLEVDAELGGGIQWIQERGDFNAAIRREIRHLTLQPFTMFAVDDSVYTGAIDLDRINYMLCRQIVDMVDLRHGAWQDKDGWLSGETGDPHRDYHFNISSAVHKTSDIKLLFRQYKRKFEIPSDIESAGIGVFSKRRVLGSAGPKGILVTHQVNQVQAKYGDEPIDQPYSVQECLNLWREGKRMDWMSTQGIEGINVGQSLWSVK